MLNLFKRNNKEVTAIQTKTTTRQYRQVAVTPAAHAKLRLIAEKMDKSIIDTVDYLVRI